MSTQSSNPRAGFVAVHGRRGAAIIARWSRGMVWAKRVLPAGPGWHPAPACMFVPFAAGSVACQFAAKVAAQLGWSVSVRPGSGGSGVWAAVNPWVPPFVAKVRLPAGMRASQARALLAPLVHQLANLL